MKKPRKLSYIFATISLLGLCPDLVGEDPCVEAKRLVQKGVSLGDSSEQELNYYRNAVGLCDSLSEAHYNFGLVKLRQGFFDEAVQAFDKAIELREKESKYLLGKAIALQNMEKAKEAKKLFLKVKQRDPENVQALQGLSRLLHQEGNLDKAISLLNEALLYRSSDIVSRFNLGALFEELKDFPKAKREYKNVLEIDPNHNKAKERLAVLLIQTDKFTEAWDLVSDLEQKNDDPTLGTLYGLKGFLAKRFGDLDKAELAYREALRINEQDMNGRLQLSNILVLKKQPALALELLTVDMLAKVDDKKLASALYNSKGWAELELGKLPDAQQSLETAVALDAGNAHAFNNLGVLFQRTKQSQKAEENFVKAIELKGDFDEARSNLKTLQSMLDEELE